MCEEVRKHADKLFHKLTAVYLSKQAGNIGKTDVDNSADAKQLETSSSDNFTKFDEGESEANANQPEKSSSHTVEEETGKCFCGNRTWNIFCSFLICKQVNRKGG